MRKGWRKGRTCAVEGCDRPHLARGYCSMHYQRWKHGYEIGDATPDLRTGRTTNVRRALYEWGPWTLNDDGYRVRRRRIAPGRYEEQAEHRMLVEHAIGRPLLPDENVHHRNGDRADNEPTNLELWTTMQPRGKRVVDLLAYAAEIQRRYGA